MPSPDQTSPVAAAMEPIPPVLLDMQRRAEKQFITLKTEERRAMALAGRRPQPFVRPARPNAAFRLLMRLLPRVARAWQMRIVRQSGLFDARWYVGRYSDVQVAGVDPVKHFLIWGAPEQRDPGPRFSTAHYLKLYPDVRASGRNPLVHYLTDGWAEKRSIHPLMPEGQE